MKNRVQTNRQNDRQTRRLKIGVALAECLRTNTNQGNDEGMHLLRCIYRRLYFLFTAYQWLNYSKVGGGTLHFFPPFNSILFLNPFPPNASHPLRNRPAPSS